MKCPPALIAAAAIVSVLPLAGGVALASSGGCPHWSGTQWDYAGCPQIAPHIIVPSSAGKDAPPDPEELSDSELNASPKPAALAPGKNAKHEPASDNRPAAHGLRSSTHPSEMPNSGHSRADNAPAEGQQMSIPGLGG